MRLGVLILLVSSLCWAQGRPKLVLEDPHYDFGTIEGSQVVHHPFKASNGGDAPLTISQLNPSCGCTSTVLGQKTLAPGESTELEVSFNPFGYRGTVQKTVEVVSDDPDAPSQTLTFDADVQAPVLASTQEVFFLDLAPRDRRKATVTLESTTGQPITLRTVDLSEAPWLGVATRELGKVLKVDFDLHARRLPPGRLSGTDTVTLHLVNPTPSQVNLRVTWEQRPPVVFSPARVAWSQPAGQELTTTVTLRSRANLPFRILSARTSHPLLTVTGLSGQAATRQSVQLRLDASAPAAVYAEKAFLTLDTPGHPELAIPVAAVLR